jgi:hypothetical protein
MVRTAVVRQIFGTGYEIEKKNKFGFKNYVTLKISSIRMSIKASVQSEK